MKVKVLLNGKEIVFDLNVELDIDDTNMDEILRNHTKSYAFLCMVQAKLTRSYKREKNKVDQVKSKEFKKIRDDYRYKKDVDEALKDNAKIRLMQDKLDELEYYRDTIQSCVRSFEVKKDLLQTLSANERKEKYNN